jgi:hypothetical protein
MVIRTFAKYHTQPHLVSAIAAHLSRSGRLSPLPTGAAAGCTHIVYPEKCMNNGPVSHQDNVKRAELAVGKGAVARNFIRTALVADRRYDLVWDASRK